MAGVKGTFIQWNKLCHCVHYKAFQIEAITAQTLAENEIHINKTFKLKTFVSHYAGGSASWIRFNKTEPQLVISSSYNVQVQAHLSHR